MYEGTKKDRVVQWKKPDSTIRKQKVEAVKEVGRLPFAKIPRHLRAFIISQKLEGYIEKKISVSKNLKENTWPLKIHYRAEATPDRHADGRLGTSERRYLFAPT